MTPKFAEAVDPVFLHVLGLLDRIGREENPPPREERLRIRGWLDQAQAILGESQDWQLAKYALVAWIDEVLIETQVPWEGQDWWKENALEVELFGTRESNEQFYMKAKESSTLSHRDALEVFYVCVMLGFRGLYRDSQTASFLAEQHGLPPDKETWARQTAMTIQLGQGRPPLTDAAASGDGTPLEGPFLLIASAFLAVVLAALVATAALYSGIFGRL
jgi:type VI secretion system protein ImpK